MRLIFTYGFALAFIVLTTGTMVEISARLQYSGAAALQGTERAVPGSPDEPFVVKRIDERIAQWEKVNAAILSPTDAAFEAARLLNAQAAQAAPDTRVTLYCRSLHQLGLGVKKEPFNARLLVSWANTRQLLGDIDCGLPYTAGRYQNVLRTATESAPADMRVKYAAAAVHLFGGNRRDAERLFGDVLAQDPSLPPDFRSNIFGHVTDRESFKTIVPPRFPQVLQFSQYLSEACNDSTRALTGAIRIDLSEAQLGAIRESASEVTSGTIPPSLHLRRLITISSVNAGEAVRRAADASISEIISLKGERELAEYYRSRSQLSSLAMLRGTITRDSRASKTPLVNWDEDSSLALDDNYRSIGFFLAQGQTPVLLELSSLESFFISGSSLKVLVSEDNQEWIDISTETRMSELDDGTNHFLSLKVPEEYHKYWKINFSSANRDRKLKGQLSSMLHAYGRSARPETTGESCL